MLVVAWIYNSNGMASWCWEAAHALHEAGQEVLLVCHPNSKLPADGNVRILSFAPPIERAAASCFARMFCQLGRLSARSSGFVGALHQHLSSRGIKPTAYLLNQSDLQDPLVEVPQIVTAWSYPTSMLGYVSKVNRISGFKFDRMAIRFAFDAVGWWRKDWRAYRSAHSTLAVSERLTRELRRKAIKAQMVYPGTATRIAPAGEVDEASDQPRRFLAAALNLEEPRKGIRFMLETLAATPSARPCEITLIGFASESFQKWAIDLGLSCSFVGTKSRQETVAMMPHHDIFLFGSALDDWGYVLIEAMGAGMILIAPRASPFDEIVGDAGYLFTSQDRYSFGVAVQSAIHVNRRRGQTQSIRRAEQLFSRRVFGERLIQILEQVV